ncbi:MAG: DUF3883 domain-containing protein, partial [Deltaproteobacteria bacterium]|nr:DUF3883 domain-containing protein [Deltaproteobacteria bacterium]
VKKEFQKWFFDFFPKDYNLDRISLISLSPPRGIRPHTNRKAFQVSPNDLIKKLRRQQEIGKVGEEVAFRYEIDRLRTLNIRDPKKWIDRVSVRNAAAGFDILTEVPRKDLRFIEVKSTISKADLIYITSNEVDTLEVHGNNAYLYVVLVTHLRRKEGRIIRVIEDPVKHLKAATSLEPILYRVRLSKPNLSEKGK